jgi:hypothetical protein
MGCDAWVGPALLRGARDAFAAVLPLASLAGCAVRVGSGGPPPPDPFDGTTGVTTACSRVGAETKLAFGAGTTAFGWLWDTDHYVVVYSDPTTGHGDIFAVTMAPDGTLTSTPVDVQATDAASDLPTIQKTPTGYLVAWQEGTGGDAVLVHALAPDATPTGSATIVAATQSNQSRPVLANAPNGQVAVGWMDTFDGKGGAQVALVDPVSLQVKAPARLAQSDIDGWPWVAGDGAALGVAWCDNSAGTYDIQFAALDPVSLAPLEQRSLRGHARSDGLLPRLIRTGFGFAAAWEDMRQADNSIYAGFIDPTGRSLGGGPVPEPGTGDANWPNLAYGASSAAIVYYQWRAHRPQIYLTLLDATGVRVHGAHDLQVSSGTAGWSRYPDVAWTGHEFGVIYVDTRSGAPALWLQRVSCPGG